MLADQLVEQGGLPGIGFAYDGDLDRIVFQGFDLGRKGSHQRIQQIPGPGAMDGGDRIRVAQAQFIKFRGGSP